MAILASDVKFLKSERMTDLDDSGGYPSNNEVLDNIDNNVFPDVASGDRIGGRTHLRKIFAAVRNNDTDVYMASRVFIGSLPSDPAVSVGLLVTNSAADERIDALDALYTEAQQNLNTNLRLFTNYNEGETIVSVYHFVNQTVPFVGSWGDLDVGKIIFFEDENAAASQYVKVTSISISSIVNNYQTATITFTPPLRAMFHGNFDDDAAYLTATQIYTTRSVPMGYGIYGCTPLAVPASSGDIDVFVNSLDVPIAPTIYETKDASVKPSVTPIQPSKFVAAVEGRIQSTTLSPMPDLDTISVYFQYQYGGQLLTKSYNGLDNGDMFTVSGTSISILLPSRYSISIEQIGESLNYFVDANLTDSFTLTNVEGGIVPGTVVLQLYSQPFNLGVWYGNFYDNGAGAFSGTLLNYSNITFTGTINYSTGVISLTFSSSVSLYISEGYRYSSTWQKFLWKYGSSVSVASQFNLGLVGDVVPGSLQIIANAADDNELFEAGDNSAGALNGDATGTIHYDSGLLALTYAENVNVDSVLINYQYTIPSAINQVSGGSLDTVRLPASKAFPLVRVGDQVMIHHPLSENLPNPVVSETTYTLSRANVDQIWLEDATGTRIPTAKYTTNLTAGSVTMAAALNLSGYQQPLVAWTALYTEAIVTTINEATRSVRLNRTLQHDYPGQQAYLSSQVPCGDLSASVTEPFAQQAWTSVWQNTIIGTEITPQFNDSVYPITVTNDGAITERWRIQFTGTTTVNIIGESVGQIATSLSITGDLAPVNPYTAQPYFTIPYQGWGAGWVNGNLLRFNTRGADYPLWAVRVVQPSDHQEGVSDRFRLTLLGDVDA